VLGSLILTGGKFFAPKNILAIPAAASLRYFYTRYAIGCKKFVSTIHALFLCVDYATFFMEDK
jgi:hypothetical protein